jgi:hypothetical protein
MLNNLFIRVDRNLAFKVYAMVDAEMANNFPFGAVIDTVDGTAVIASLSSIKLSDHMWEAVKTLPKLQIGHEFVRITQ